MVVARFAPAVCACALALGAVTACDRSTEAAPKPSVASSANSSPSASVGLSSVGSSAPAIAQVFGPPQPPCVYPTGADLVTLEEDSTIVVTATVPAGPDGNARPTPTASGNIYDESLFTTRLSNVRVLSRAADAPTQTPTTLIGIVPFYEPAGDYLLFLHQAVGHGAIADPAHGIRGMFRIFEGNLTLRCFDGRDPDQVTAPGTLPEASLIAEISKILPAVELASPTPSPPT
jgi:hypothetical protein